MRARDIKPGFYKNEQLAECSPWARLIFPGLWMIADKNGCLEYRPKRLKIELLPYDNQDIATLIDELEHQDLVIKYSVGGCEYLFIPGFAKNQSPHPNEKAGAIPSYSEHLQSTPEITGALPKLREQSPLFSSSLPSSSLPPEDLNLPSGDMSPSATSDPCPEQEKGEEQREAIVCPDCPHEKILAMYHETLPELSRAATWGKDRQALLRSRWRETWDRLRKADKPHDLSALLGWWAKYFARVRASPFLIGQELDRNGRPFYADLEWLVRPNNYAKVIDGKYLKRSAA